MPGSPFVEDSLFTDAELNSDLDECNLGLDNDFAFADEEEVPDKFQVVLLGEGTIKNPFLIDLKKTPFIDLNRERAFMIKLLLRLGVDSIYYRDSHVKRRKLRKLNKNNLEN